MKTIMTRGQTKGPGTRRWDKRDHLFAKGVRVNFMEDEKYPKECGGFQLTGMDAGAFEMGR